MKTGDSASNIDQIQVEKKVYDIFGFLTHARYGSLSKDLKGHHQTVWHLMQKSSK